MKLYMSPDTCALADHIALNEAGLDFETVSVDVFRHRIETDNDFYRVNPKGYVPALVMDDGSLLTENVAILTWIAEQADHLRPKDMMARTRLIEMLAFIEAEIHKPFIRSFFTPSEEGKAYERKVVAGRLAWLADTLKDDHLLGPDFTVADAFLYVMLRWAKMSDMEMAAPLTSHLARMEQRPAVRQTLEQEGLTLRAAA